MNTLADAPVVVHVDAYTGPEIAKKALAAGENKAKLPFLPTFILGIMAGAYIAFAAVLFTLVTTDSGLGFGMMRLVGGLVFCLGLILVVVGGAELFTGNTLIIMAWLSGRVGTGKLLRNWVIVYLGNLVGSLLVVGLVFASGHWGMDKNAVGATAISIATVKVSHTWGATFASGILCNALVCLAVWLCYGARTTTDKIMAILFPITAFVACGFEHCVANMYFIPAGIFAALDERFVDALPAGASTAALTWSNFINKNLIPATLGNIVGGALMVGAVYWVAYILPEHWREAQARKEQGK